MPGRRVVPNRSSRAAWQTNLNPHAAGSMSQRSKLFEPSERQTADRKADEKDGLLQPIPKVDGIDVQFDVTVAALEDKIIQGATAMVLNAIYEGDFVGFSYGFRPGRGPHDGLDALCAAIDKRKVNWIIDADIQNFLDPLSYCPLAHEVASKSLPCRAITLMHSPFCRPRVT